MLHHTLACWSRYILFILLTMLAGCFGSGDGEAPVSDSTLKGALLDGLTSGVSYSTATQSGITDANGEFNYFPGETIVFSIGGITLGEVLLLKPDPTVTSLFLTPVELTGSTDASDPNVIRLLQLLQSLDSDGDHSNGITISAATRAAAASFSYNLGDPSFAANNPTFDLQSLVDDISDPADPVPQIVSAGEALQNFSDTIEANNLSISLTPSFQLVWSDEFNATTLNTEDWNFETGYGPNNAGWGNDEWQLYTQNSDNLAIVFEDGSDATNGYLKISALCPAANGVDNAACQKRDGSITSAKINTKDKQEFQFGKIEARIKVPTGKGAWPAFWSLGAGFPETPWPASGEIDFMEVFSVNNSTAKDGLFTIHWEEPDGSGERQFVTSTKPIDASEFHVFEAEWNQERIIGKIDGTTFANYALDPVTQSELLKPFYLILNVAMGGSPVADLFPDATTPWPQEMLVDYVRVYQAIGDFAAGVIDIDFEGGPSEFVCFEGGAGCGGATGFAGGDASIQPNPDTQGNNPSANVARFQKFNPGNGEAFGGTIIRLTEGALDFAASNNIMTMKIYSTRAVPVRMELGDDNPDDGSPGLDMQHTGNGWEEFTLDISGLIGSVTKLNQIVLIFDNGTVGDAGNNPDQWTFYFDDIVLQKVGTDNGEGTGGGDTGGGTGNGTGLGVFSETNTSSAITNTNIASAGNTVVIDGESTAVTPFDGSVVLSLDYQAGGNGFGGAVFEFDAVDLSAYDTLKFTIDTSGITDFANLTVQIEPPAGGTAGGNVLLASYTPVATSGNWKTYEIPFTDFTAVTFTGVNVNRLGFFNLSDSAGLTTGAIYLDDIHFALVAHQCVASVAGELAVNGGFDSNFAGWTQFPSAQTTQAIVVDPTTSSNVARLFIPASAGGVNNVLKQERLGDGNAVFSSGDVVNISFDYRGEAGEGIMFVKSVCETASGVCGDKIHNNGGPFTPTANWTSYSDTFTIAAGVSGYTLEFAAVCGGTGTCVADYFVDNVSISIAGAAARTANRTANRHACDTAGGTEPTVAAPTPPARVAGDVISVFSGAYTDVAGSNFFPDWGQTTVVTTEVVAGDDTLKYASFNYEGTVLGGVQDASAMTHLHIDLWTADATVVQVSPIQNTGTTEVLVSLTPISAGWNSYDIPIADFTGMTWVDIKELKFDGQAGVTPSTIYLDNIYFYKAAAATEPTVAAPTPPTRVAGDVISVFSGAYTDIAGSNFFPDWGQSTVVTTEVIAGDDTLKYASFNYEGTVLGGVQDASAMEFLHIDLWTADATVVQVSPIQNTGTTEVLVSLTPISAGWNSYDIPIADFTGMTWVDIKELKFDGQAGVNPSTIYLDNIYFYKVAGGGSGAQLAINGDFELGSLSGWTEAIGGGTGATISADNTQDSGSTWTAHVVAGPGNNPAISQAGLAVGTVAPGDTIDVSFDMCGSAASGGVIFPALLSEFGGNSGADRTNLATIASPPSVWTRFNYSGVAGSNVAGGVSLQLDVICGADTGCSADVYFDNVSVTIGGGPVAGNASGASCVAGGGGGGGGGTGGTGQEVSTNGDFETGDLTGWTEDGANTGIVAIDNTQANGGTWSVKLAVDAGQESLIRQANVGIGLVMPGDEITISFDMFGSLAGDGGVVFAEFFSELDTSGGGTSKTEILGGGPIFPTNTWTNYSYTTTAGSDVTGGVTLLLKSSCGAVTGCGVEAFFDNVSITFVSPVAATAPTVAAPTPPTRVAGDVISVFSGAYTDIAGSNFFPDWGQSTVVTTEVIAGDDTLKYASFNYEGTVLGGVQDASAMEFLHIDMWTADATVVQVSPIQNTGTTEVLVSLTPISAGWNSYDIPIADFTGMTWVDIKELKFDGQAGVNPSTIYLDNIYFYKEAAAIATVPTVAAPTPPTRVAGDVISVFSGAYTDIAGSNFFPDWGQTTVVTTEVVAGDDTLKYANFNYEGTVLGGVQDASAMTHLHIDLWTADATVVKVSPIQNTGTVEFLVSLTPISAGWNSYDIPIADFTGMTWVDIKEMKFDGQAGVNPSTIYLDNIYFYK